MQESESAKLNSAELESQIEAVKIEIERPNSSPDLVNRYDRLVNPLNDCRPTSIFMNPNISGFLSPAASLCINGSLAISDPT